MITPGNGTHHRPTSGSFRSGRSTHAVRYFLPKVWTAHTAQPTCSVDPAQGLTRSTAGSGAAMEPVVVKPGLGDEPELAGAGDGLGAVGRAELAEHMGDVFLDGGE